MEEVLQRIQSENREKNIRVKGIILLGILSLCFVLLLFTDMLVYTEAGVRIPINGLRLIEAVFYGNSVGYYLFGEVVYVHIPVYVTIVYFVMLAAVLGLAAYIAVRMTFKGAEEKTIGIALTAVGGAIVLYYVALLTFPFIKAENLYGESVRFYRAFELSVAILLVGIIAVLSGVLQLFLNPKRIPKVKRFWFFYLLLIVPTVAIAIFSLYPIFLQVVLAFKDYKLSDGIWGSEWIGFENFVYMFTDPLMLKVIWQTIYLSFLRLLAGIIPSVFFAFVFYDMGAHRYRKVVQTVVYIPHFFSWVIIYAIISTFLMPSGIVNNILTEYFHMEPIDFLSKPELFYLNMILSSIWKEVGWGTILYLAALGNIDPSLYEAASLDGCGALKKVWYITLPGMVPIIVFQTIMAIGNLLKSAGGEQVLLFATGSVKNNKALVIDTWLYWQGLGELKYGLSAAVSFAQSVIGFIMVVGSHKLSKRLVGIGAW